jgi:hypothetical protein
MNIPYLDPELDEVGEFVWVYLQDQVVVKVVGLFIFEVGMASKQLLVSFPVLSDDLPEALHFSVECLW